MQILQARPHFATTTPRRKPYKGLQRVPPSLAADGSPAPIQLAWESQIQGGAASTNGGMRGFTINEVIAPSSLTFGSVKARTGIFRASTN
jgi:hypothetical protein